VTPDVIQTTFEAVGYQSTITSPRYGALLLCQSARVSNLADALVLLWERDRIPEFAEALKRDYELNLSTGHGDCHRLVFEFQYALVASYGPDDTMLNHLRWVVADTAERGEHSWVECRDEAFDVVLSTQGSALWVRSTQELRQHYTCRNVESRTFTDVRRWTAGRFSVLFPKHRALNDALLQLRQRVWESGKLVVVRT
jgi:hypothetical protein